jgi:transcriptional regulator with XRE-family HTH domain
MAPYLVTRSSAIRALVEHEHRLFAVKLRTARAILGWSQTEFGARTGLSQRAVHKIEQGETEPRRATVYAIEQLWREVGIIFEPTSSGLSVTVSNSTLGHWQPHRHDARPRAGVTAKNFTKNIAVTAQRERSGARRLA